MLFIYKRDFTNKNVLAENLKNKLHMLPIILQNNDDRQISDSEKLKSTNIFIVSIHLFMGLL